MSLSAITSHSFKPCKPCAALFLGSVAFFTPSENCLIEFELIVFLKHSFSKKYISWEALVVLVLLISLLISMNL